MRCAKLCETSPGCAVTTCRRSGRACAAYEIKLWGGNRIKWAACDAELGGLESFQPKGNAALDFSYECAE